MWLEMSGGQLGQGLERALPAPESLGGRVSVNGGAFRVTVRLSERVRWTVSVDISEHPSTLGSMLSQWFCRACPEVM